MKVKILHVLTSLEFGGAEGIIMDLYRNIDRDKVQFDFMVRNKRNRIDLMNEIKSLGGQIFILSDFPSEIRKNYRELEVFFSLRAKEYKAIHVHANSLIYTKPLKLAKKYNVPCRIIHSHNTRTSKKYFKLIHLFNRLFINIYATDFFSCSKLAGEWMFGNRKYRMINNGIYTEKFVIDYAKRESIRNELGLKEKFVVGHIGRFVEQKNHTFIIDIFNELYKINKDAVLFLVGAGDDHRQNEIRKKVKRLGIENQVIFAGARKDVHDLMQAFDAFLFPSLYEGLPITLVEAQAAGLPCVISDTISKQTIITNLVKKMSLKESPRDWAAELNKSSKIFERLDMSEVIRERGFEIKSTASLLEKFYSELG